jgi:acyl-CoA-binding protein
MAAEIVDEREIEREIKALEDLEVNEPDAPAEDKPADDLPDKYRGKSLHDIVRMHQEAEKALGRNANEVGELRKVVDDFITKQTELSTTKDNAPDDVDFFADPQSAVNRTVESHPAFKELKQLTAQQKQATAQADMARRHPDAQQLVQDSKFLEWVMASKIRQSLLVKADREYDVDAADELFTTWKERQQLVTQTVSSETTARKAAVKQASTGGNSAAMETQTKKKYRRADIIKLMQTDPDRYEAMMPEIRQAYQEGRVV